MHLEGLKTTTETVQVNVTPERAWKALRRLIHKAEGMTRPDYLRKRGDTYVFTEDDHHPHGSDTETELDQKPTPRQIEVWEALDKVQELVKFYNLD